MAGTEEVQVAGAEVVVQVAGGQCTGGAQEQRSRGAEVVLRCRCAKWMLNRCRCGSEVCGAEQVMQFGRCVVGVELVQRCLYYLVDAEQVQRCRGGAEVQVHRFTGGAEVHSQLPGANAELVYY